MCQKKERIEVWESLPRDSRGCMETPGCPETFVARAGPSWRTSARAVLKGNVGSEPPHRVATRALPSGAVRRSLCPPDPRMVDPSTGCTMHLEKLQTVHASHESS